jgi:L-rhamnono-1,4-lactonase
MAPIPIIDSHVHLWTQSQLSTLAWHSAQNPLGAQHSVEEYLSSAKKESTSNDTQKYLLRGFIYLEVDRVSSTDERDWTHVLDEISFLARIARGSPLQDEGHVDSHKQILLGFVPWAPVPGGRAVMERYMMLAKERIVATRSDASSLENIEGDEVWKKLRGVRYLVQDKPVGTMLQSGFVEGLRWLGKLQLAFDLGVDARQGGLWQLREAVELLQKVYDGVEENDRLRVVISEIPSIIHSSIRTDKRNITDHLCKPNLRISSNETVIDHPDFLEWKSLVTAMATASSTTYMKLSGLFSEVPPLDEDCENENAAIDCIVTHARPWTDVVFDVFGAHRIMFGSDWPVCTVGNGAASSTETKKREGAWSRWRAVVESILEKRGLSEDEKRDVWGGVAVRAYGIS